MSGQEPDHNKQLRDIASDIADRFGWKVTDAERILALDGYGRTLWLKVRSEEPDPTYTSWDWSSTSEPEYDLLIGILLTKLTTSYAVHMIVRAMRGAVEDVKRPDQDPASKKVRFRWNDESRHHPGVKIIFPLDGTDPTLRRRYPPTSQEKDAPLCPSN